MSTATHVPGRYRIADLVLDTATRQVSRDGREIVLPALSFDLLLVLARHAPRVLSIDELMSEVWPGRVVNSETVAKRVELVREALGDASQVPRYIALVRGRGYRLLAPVSTADSSAVVRPEVAAPPARHTRRSMIIAAILVALAVVTILAVSLQRGGRDAGDLAAARVPSVAVLPFLNLSDDASNVYFSDGISEELLGVLAQIPDLRVASRTSSFAFRSKQVPLPEIARALNVSHILEGSVRRSGNQIRISAQLIEVATDSHLWAQTYDRELKDIFAIQDEIARAIAGALQIKLADDERGTMASAERQTSNLEAYELYLHGRHLWNMRGENVRQAVQLLERAVALDPQYAQAYAMLAQVYVNTYYHYGGVDPKEAIALGERAAARAIELDPSLSSAYAAQGDMAASQMQWMRARKVLQRAIELDPNDATAQYWFGVLLYVTGHVRETLPAIQRAHELDPIMPWILSDLGGLYMNAGDFERGCTYFQRFTEVTSGMIGNLGAASCFEAHGNPQAAHAAEAEYEKTSLAPGVIDLVRRAVKDPSLKPEALAALRALAVDQPYFVFEKLLDLGDLDSALDHLEATLARYNYVLLRQPWLQHRKALRQHPRFRALAARIGLVEYWRQYGWPDVCRPKGESFECD